MGGATPTSWWGATVISQQGVPPSPDYPNSWRGYPFSQWGGVPPPPDEGLPSSPNRGYPHLLMGGRVPPFPNSGVPHLQMGGATLSPNRGYPISKWRVTHLLTGGYPHPPMERYSISWQGGPGQVSIGYPPHRPTPLGSRWWAWEGTWEIWPE